MRIAQIAPLYEAVPPKLYGGTERVVAHLTNALVARGHDVTLFASGDSETNARLVSCRNIALRLDKELSWAVPAHLSMLATSVLVHGNSTFCTFTSIATTCPSSPT